MVGCDLIRLVSKILGISYGSFSSVRREDVAGKVSGTTKWLGDRLIDSNYLYGDTGGGLAAVFRFQEFFAML